MLDLLLPGEKTAPDFLWDSRGGVLPCGATFTRGSSGWYFNSAGVLAQAGSNVARFEWEPSTLAPLGYLAERQSTNAVAQSQALTATGWTTANLTVTDNAQVAPDGTTTASTVKEDGTTNAHKAQYDTVSPVSGSVYGVSVFAKNVSGSRWLQLNVSGSDYVNFQPSTGMIGSLGSANVSNAVARQLANGWWRFSFAYTAPSTGTTSVRLYTANAGNAVGGVSYAGDGASTIAVWGLQFESASAGVTSYIPTSGSAVTRARAADLLALPLASLPGWRPNAGGVLMAIYRLNTIPASSEQTVAYFTDGSGNLVDCRAQSGTQSGSNASGLLTRNTDIIQINTATNIVPFPTPFLRRKQAFGWGLNRGQIAIDGVTTIGANGSYLLPVRMDHPRSRWQYWQQPDRHPRTHRLLRQRSLRWLCPGGDAMSGWQTVYLDTGDEATARVLAQQLGSELQPGQFAAGDANYCFLAYTPLAGHDDATWSYAVLARFNTDRPEGLAACNAVLATSYVKAPANPSNVWAS